MILAITIFGIGSAKQKAMENNVHEAVRELNVPIKLRRVEDVDLFMSRGITEIPSLMINDKIVYKGTVPEVEELKKKLSTYFPESPVQPYTDPLAPVSEIMTTDLIVIDQDDNLSNVKDIFNKKRIHHLPVVSDNDLVGMLSKSDFLKFSYGLKHNNGESGEDEKLLVVKVKDVMTKGVAKLQPTDKISVAAYIFKENLFHALPIVEGKRLVGIVTTYDLINYSFGNPLIPAS